MAEAMQCSARERVFAVCDRLAEAVQALDAEATRFVERREERAAKLAARQNA